MSCVGDGVVALLTVSYSLNGGGSGSVTVQSTDPVATQTLAIQQALNQVANNPLLTGGTVTLSAGTFTVQPGLGASGADGVLRIGSNTTLLGAGEGLTVIKMADGFNQTVTGIIRTDSGTTLADGTFKTTHDVTISGLTIDGNKAGNPTGSVDGFYCGPKPNSSQVDDHITLSHVTVQNCSRYGFDPHEQTTNLSFENCTATGNKDGFTVDDCSLVAITNCAASGNTRHGFNIVTGSHDVTLTNCTATGNAQSGIVIQTGNNEIRDWTHNVTVIGGVASGNGATGLTVRQADGILINGLDLSGQVPTLRALVEGTQLNADHAAQSVGAQIGVDLIGVTSSGGVALTTANGLTVKNYLQEFIPASGTDLTDVDDRYILTSNVRYGATGPTTTATPTGTNTTGATLWTYHLHDDANLADNVAGTTADDFMAAGAGNDTVDGGAGDDTLHGADGNDNLSGGDGIDTLEGNAGNDTLYGGAGIDAMIGGIGSDTLVGNADVFAQESDTLDGGFGDDIIYGEYTDAIIGGKGYDVLYAVNDFGWTIDLGATGIEWFQAGFGNDVIIAANQSVAVTVFAGGGDDSVTGSAFADQLWASAGNDTLIGGSGDDMLFGDTGADNLSGGDGNDRLYVDNTDTSFNGGAGFDAAYITAGAGMSINLATTNVEWIADYAGGNDTLNGAALTVDMTAYAGGGDDVVTGGSGNDFLWGEGGNNTLTGNGGNDTLVGGIGADILTGGTGIDTIYMNSGGGSDGVLDRVVLTAGWGTNFVFDFTHGEDKIDLSALGTNFAALSIANVSGHAYIHIGVGTDLIVVANNSGLLTATDFIF